MTRSRYPRGGHAGNDMGNDMDDLDLVHLDEADLDPDLVLITEYLARELSRSDERAVRQRLEMDAAFYRKVAPLIAVWQTPTPVSTDAPWAADDPDVLELESDIEAIVALPAEERRAMERAWLSVCESCGLVEERT